MTTTTFLTEKQQSLLLPDEEYFLERKGFDRPAIRRELAPVTPLSAGDRYVEQGDAIYATPTSDMPESDTTPGEIFGNVDVERVVGEQVRIPRMTHGLTVDQEDLEIQAGDDTPSGADKLQRERDLLMEMFDVQADYQFMQGIHDERGNQVQPGVFEYLDANIPASNIIDASSTQYSNSGEIPANVIVQEAYSKLTGEYANDGWDVAFAKHDVHALWNTIDNNSGVTQKSHWLDLESDSDGVGQSIVNDFIKIPEKIGLRTAPEYSAEELRFDVDFPTANNGTDDDVMYLIPDHGGDFYELYEQAQPQMSDTPVRKEGLKERHEFYWRAGQTFNLNHRVDDVATDAIKIENVSALNF
jgi:hypothetical protein